MKTSMIKRILSICMVLVTIVSLSIPAFAASTSAFDILTPSKYANTRTISTGDTIVYTDKTLNYRGTETFGRSKTAYVDGTDDLRVMDVGCTNNKWWAHIQYKTGSGKNVRGYIYLSAITANNGSHKKTVSTGKFYCALRENESTQSKYYVAKNDVIYLLAVSSSGEKYQILYPAGGVYRIAWVSKADYLKYNGEAQPVANGTYTIVSALNSNKVVDICNASTKNGGNVQLYQGNGTKAQQFQLVYNNEGYYTIKNVGSGLVLDVAGGRVASGVNVQQYESNNTKAQRWFLESAGNGYYYIRSALGYYLDVANASTSNGTNIRVWTGNKTNAQKFKFVACNNNSSGKTPVAVSMTSVLYGLSANETKLIVGFDGYTGTYAAKGYRHEGIDFYYKDQKGATVYSLIDGEITRVYESGTNLSTIAIYNKEHNLTVIYLHVNPYDSLKSGDMVKKGTALGNEASFGTTNTHTHVEIRLGRHTHASVSMDATLSNPDPTPYWTKLGYTVK